MIVRKNGLNEFGVRFDGSVTSVMRKRSNLLSNIPVSIREGGTSDIFPTRDIAVPTFETMRSYLASPAAVHNHGQEAVDRMLSLPIWQEWENIARREAMTDPALIGSLWKTYTVLEPREAVDAIAGGVEYSRDVMFSLSTTSVETAGGRRTSGFFHKGGYVSVMLLRLNKWGDNADSAVPVTLFELGLWWSHVMPVTVHATGFLIGEIANLYGFPMETTTMTAIGDANLVDATGYYRNSLPKYDALVWVAMACSTYPMSNGEPIRFLIEVLDEMDAGAFLHESMSRRDVHAMTQRGISLSSLRLLREEVGADLDRAIAYYIAGVRPVSAIPRYIESDVDVSMALSLSDSI